MKKLIRNNNISFVPVDEGMALLNPDGDTLYVLNKTAYDIWKCAEKAKTIDEISRELAKEYKVESSSVRNDINKFINTLPNDLPLFEKQ